jgi:sec-independent protein translocase protein TatA
VSVGPFQILIIALILLVLFGRGRISELLGDIGRGTRRFREGLSDDSPALLEAVPTESDPAVDKTAG